MFKNIILHWTAGNYKPSSTDIKHYHYLIDSEGLVRAGEFEPKDNLNCTDGRYAAHCGGGNTGRIGIAICCCKDKDTPPTRKQVEAMCHLSARLCKIYGLKPYKCITHAEFGAANPKTSSAGKVDISYLPYAKVSGITPTGDYLRCKIQWYYNRLKGV